MVKKNYKYFIDYKGDYKIKPSCILLPQKSAYTRSYLDKIKCIPFLIEDDELLEKFSKFWDKVSNTIKKTFDSGPLYNGNYLKTKIRSYEGKKTTDFHDK